MKPVDITEYAKSEEKETALENVNSGYLPLEMFQVATVLREANVLLHFMRTGRKLKIIEAANNMTNLVENCDGNPLHFDMYTLLCNLAALSDISNPNYEEKGLPGNSNIDSGNYL